MLLASGGNVGSAGDDDSIDAAGDGDGNSSTYPTNIPPKCAAVSDNTLLVSIEGKQGLGQITVIRLLSNIIRSVGSVRVFEQVL